MDGAQLGDLLARRHFILKQHSEQACHQRHQHIHLLEFTITPHRQARMHDEREIRIASNPEEAPALNF